MNCPVSQPGATENKDAMKRWQNSGTIQGFAPSIQCCEVLVQTFEPRAQVYKVSVFQQALLSLLGEQLLSNSLTTRCGLLAQVKFEHGSTDIPQGTEWADCRRGDRKLRNFLGPPRFLS